MKQNKKSKSPTLEELKQKAIEQGWLRWFLQVTQPGVLAK